MSIKVFEFETFSGVTTKIAVDTEWKNKEFNSLKDFCRQLNEYFVGSEDYLDEANGCHIKAALTRIAKLVPIVKLGDNFNDYGTANNFHEVLGSEAYPNLDGSYGIYLLSTSAGYSDFEVELNSVSEISLDSLKENIPTGSF